MARRYFYICTSANNHDNFLREYTVNNAEPENTEGYVLNEDDLSERDVFDFMMWLMEHTFMNYSEIIRKIANEYSFGAAALIRCMDTLNVYGMQDYYHSIRKYLECIGGVNPNEWMRWYMNTGSMATGHQDFNTMPRSREKSCL